MKTTRRHQNEETLHFGHNMRKQSLCLEKEITQGMVPGKRKRGRPPTTWMENIVHWMMSSSGGWHHQWGKWHDMLISVDNGGD